MDRLTPKQEDYLLEAALEQKREKEQLPTTCPICGTEKDEDDDICLRCSKEIVDAQEEQYHKTQIAEMELSRR